MTVGTRRWASGLATGHTPAPGRVISSVWPARRHSANCRLCAQPGRSLASTGRTGEHRAPLPGQAGLQTVLTPGAGDDGDLALALITTGWAGLSSFVWAQSNTDPCSNPFNIYLTLQCVLLYAACLISDLSKVP